MQCAIAAECLNPLNEGAIYMAASSEERGYARESYLFDDSIQDTMQVRAEALCGMTSCKSLRRFEIETFEHEGMVQALTVKNLELPPLVFSRLAKPEGDLQNDWKTKRTESPQPELMEKEFQLEKAWFFANNGSRKVGNAMWYLGHAISVSSPMSLLSGPFAAIVGPIWAGTGGLITISSRFMEKHPLEITPEHALQRLSMGKVIHKVSKTFGKKIPHFVFKEIECSE